MKRLTQKYYITYIVVIMLAVLGGLHVRAFEPEAYAPSSRLAEGHWVKFKVDDDGLYILTPTQLRSWGFTDLSRVRVYGYGGRRLPLALTRSSYIDDLPEVQSQLTDRGIVFYAQGPLEPSFIAGTDIKYLRQNDYSNSGYYFVGESDEEARTIGSTGTAGAQTPARSYTAVSHHEQELVPVPGEAGPLLLGEDFRYTRQRTFQISAPGAIEGEISFVTSFVSAMTGAGSSLSFSVNGEDVAYSSSDALPASSSSHYIHGNETVTTHTLEAKPRNGYYIVDMQLNQASGCNGAWLNYLSINYPAALTLENTSGHLVFTTERTQLALGGARADMTVWDVTDPMDIKKVNTTLAGNEALWTSSLTGERVYAAWQPGADLPSPRIATVIANQNLHADRDLDMVIVAPSQFTEHAMRLANMHSSSADTLQVKVVDPESIYNEFSSGVADPGGIRRYFKMLYDRGKAGDGRPLRYAILMARTALDNRGLTSAAPDYPAIPSWMPDEVRASLSDNEGYCTDDITAMLDDNSGLSIRTDKLSIALGRMPVITTDEAREVVDKAIQYALGARKSSWKHRYMFLADDQDNSIHMKQTEKMISEFENADRQQHLVRKVYLDAYPFVGSTYPEARSAMYRYLDEGVVWWNFIGHASTTGWTGENMLSYTDLNNLYLRHWPFIYAATCDFMRLDGTRITGGEILYKERYGGAIGIISAVRPVYISDNGLLSSAMGRALAQRDSEGRLLTPGEIYRTAKNDLRDNAGLPVGDTNRLRYCFIGDPALRLAMPSNIVRVDEIGGVSSDSDEQAVMPALGRIPVKGSVTDPDGNVLSDFNGVVMVEIFDAERSRVTLASRDESSEEPFEDYGERLYCGSVEVKGGRFSLTAAMPLETSQNFRPGAMSLYAYSTEDDTEAVGLARNFYVYGYDESAPADDKAPVIESMVLNHSTFASGDVVNQSPMMIAEVRDDVGLNMSNVGVGHQMTATLDGTKTFTDLSFYFTPLSDGTPGGVINYPFEDLQPGNHTLSLRVWDTAGNSATREVDFFVQENMAPKIYDVYTDANPASTQANFYLSHDQPDNMLTVTVTVYNLMGRPLWSGTSKGRSDMFLTVPVTWDLTDGGGRRVGRGIYLYRASITADGQTYETASRRIAVTAQ